MKENLKTVSKLLNDFSNFINNRSIIFLSVLGEVFPKILEWHFEMWEKTYRLIKEKEKLDEWASYNEVLRVSDSIVEIIEERALKERASFSFFEQLKEHIDKHQKKVIGEHYYAKYFFMNVFCPIFFKNITDSPERYDVWKHYFPQKPQDWKITKNNLKDKENIIPNIILHEFLRWTQDRILKREEEFDKKLEDVSENLFPEVEPIIWSRVLVFVLSSYGESRVKSMIERPWNFGFIGRMRTYSGFPSDSEKELDKKMSEAAQSEKKTETEKTFELAYLFFMQQFSKENLEKYIKEIKALKEEYGEDSKEERKRLELLDIFKGMEKYIEEVEKEKLKK